MTELTIANISFVNCQAERNSTSYYNDSELPEPFLVGIYCWMCANVALDQVQVSDSSGIGMVFYETGGNNNISHSVFSRNQFPMNGTYKGGGGGVTVEYPYCPPGTPKPDCDGCVSSYNSNSTFQFINCTFDDNYSFLMNSSEYTFIRPGNNTHIAFGRGGGLTLYFKGKAQNNTVTIDTCTFSSNTALFGGGLLSEFQDTSTGNRVIVLDSLFLYNHCPYAVNVGTSGGGIRIGFTFFLEDSRIQVANSFIVESTVFIGNKAYVGGGLSFITGKQASYNTIRIFYLNNCTWKDNVARLGAAMDVTEWGNVQDGSLPFIQVVDCIFVGNSIWYTEESQREIVGCGVVYADTVPIQFAGLTKFINNTGSGIAIRSTFVSFLTLEDSGGGVLFQHNQARDGGGIAIYGDAWIEVYPGYSLNFTDNHAFYRGGAIFYEDVGNRNLLSSRRCFIQYSNSTTPREQWNASFNFVNNTARQNGNSIFCTSLIPCVWGGVEGSGSLSPSAIRKTFHWNDTIFSYECTKPNCTNEIASGPSNVTFTNPAANSSNDYFVFSGEQSDVPFYAIDDLGLQVYTSFYVSASGHLTLKSNVASKHYTASGCPNTTRDSILTFFSIEDLPLRIRVNVSISECPPGYVKQDPPECSCVCLSDPDYIVSCNNSIMTAKMRQGCWTGCLNVNESSPLHSYSNYVYGYCANQFCNTKDVPLLNDTNQTCETLNDHICGYSGQNRSGVLCSGCNRKKGYGISLTSWDYQCVKCPPGAGNSAAAFFILLFAEILPLLLFIVLIMMFDINILAAPVYSFIFFCQVKHILLPLDQYDKSELYTFTRIDRFLSGLLNLRFFGLFIPPTAPTCISQNLNVLDILLIRYAVLFFPILIIGITLSVVKAFISGYCCGPLQTAVGMFVRCMNKLKENWTPGTSILRGLCGFLVLAYADLVRISTIILTPAYLNDASGNLVETRVRVQGDMHFLHSEHLPYAFVAILVLAVLVIVPCFLLLTHPLLHQFLIYRKLGERRPFKWIIAFYVSNRLKPIFDCFQGCFQGKMGFFAGLFLFYRIAFLLVVVIAENEPTHLLLAKLLLILIIFFLHSFFHPYNENKAFVNKVDSYMFLLMGALVALVYFNYVETTDHHSPKEAWLWIQLIVQYLPYVYFLILVGWYIHHRLKRRVRRYRRCCWWKPLLLDKEMEESLEGSYGAFDQDRRGAVQDEWLNDEN